MIRSIETAGKFSAVIGLVGLLVLSAAILSDALMRTILNAPIYGLSDLVEIVTPVVVASCFPIALTNRQNITIRFLGRALPARPGQVVELFGQLAALIVFIGIVWEMGRYTMGLIEYGQFTWLLRIPVWPSWILATLLLALCIPIQASVVIETFRQVRSGAALTDSESELLDTIEPES